MATFNTALSIFTQFLWLLFFLNTSQPLLCFAFGCTLPLLLYISTASSYTEVAFCLAIFSKCEAHYLKMIFHILLEKKQVCSAICTIYSPKLLFSMGSNLIMKLSLFTSICCHFYC